MLGLRWADHGGRARVISGHMPARRGWRDGALLGFARRFVAVSADLFRHGHSLRTSRWCQRSSVAGVTMRLARTEVGRSLTSAEITGRSAQSGCGFASWRRRTATSWRSMSSSASLAAVERSEQCGQPRLTGRIKISAVFHASSCRDSRSHAAIRVIRRKTSRRNMTVDHYDRMPGRATPLARAMDGILGTHSTILKRGACPRLAGRSLRLR